MVGMAHLWLLGWRPVKPPPLTQAHPPQAIVVRLTAPKPSQPAPPVAATTAPRPRRAPPVASPRGTAGAPPLAIATPPPHTPNLLPYLPAPVVLNLLWQQGPATRPARLRWQIDADGFVLSLETTPETPARSASWLRSQGSLRVHGLAPARHSVRQAPGSEQALTFIREGGDVAVAFSARTYTRPAPADVQDALSWLPQWLARLAAGRPEQPIEVADVAGRVHPWQFRPDEADPWHWRTEAVADQTAIELWLQPEAPHWPLRMVITPAWGAPWVLWRSAPQAGAVDE